MMGFYDLQDMFYLDSMIAAEKPRGVVLIVDDNTDTLLLAQRALGKMNAELVVARSVEAALEFLDFRTPDMVVTDLMFPEKSGFALLERLQNSTRLCHVPALVMSGKRSEEFQDKARRLGAVSYLMKPFAPQTLTQSVAAYL